MTTHAVLNDPLIQDSIAINLAQTVAKAQNGKTHFSVEEFVKNVLELFAFNKKVQENRKDLVIIDETEDEIFYAYKEQIEQSKSFINDNKIVNQDSAFQLRVFEFDDDNKVDLTLVSPEVLSAFEEVDEQILALLPDSVLSCLLKKCSDKNSIFLDSNISMTDRILIFRGKRDYEGKTHNDVTLLNKTYTSRNVVSNLEDIASKFSLDELQKLFETDENGNLKNKKAPAYFQNLILSHPNGAYYNGYMVDLYRCLGYFE